MVRQRVGDFATIGIGHDSVGLGISPLLLRDACRCLGLGELNLEYGQLCHAARDIQKGRYDNRNQPELHKLMGVSPK